MATGRGALIPAEDRIKVIELFREGLREGAPAKAIADLIGICSRTLRRWGIALEAYGFSQDRRKGSPRVVAHRFSEEERQQVLETVNDSLFADLTPAQIVAILAEEGIYVGSESTIYRIMRQEGLLRSCTRTMAPPCDRSHWLPRWRSWGCRSHSPGHTSAMTTPMLSRGSARCRRSPAERLIPPELSA